MPCRCRSCQHVGMTVVVIAVIAVVAAIIFIFSFDLPGGDNVRGGPMNKYKIITTHFQVGRGCVDLHAAAPPCQHDA